MEKKVIVSVYFNFPALSGDRCFYTTEWNLYWITGYDLQVAICWAHMLQSGGENMPGQEKLNCNSQWNEI